MRWLLVTSALLLAGCEDDYNQRVDRLEKAVAAPISSSGDFWIVKRGDVISEQQFKVGLIFGYGDNELVCTELIDVYKKKFRTEQLSCVPAN